VREQERKFETISRVRSKVNMYVYTEEWHQSQTTLEDMPEEDEQVEIEESMIDHRITGLTLIRRKSSIVPPISDAYFTQRNPWKLAYETFGTFLLDMLFSCKPQRFLITVPLVSLDCYLQLGLYIC
jgi:hypothetical protein